MKKNYNKRLLIFNNYFQNILRIKREEIFNEINRKVKLNNKLQKLDVGTSPFLSEVENTFIQKLNGENITSISDQDCNILKKKFKKIKIIKKNATKIAANFKKFDIVHSNATIEHVGNLKNQKIFLKKLYNITKKTLIVTTPNRFHPIEFHTKILMLHWLPKKIFRLILKIFGDNFYSKEKNLNLLSEENLKMLCRVCKFKTYEILKIKFLGFTSNLILIVSK